MARLCKAGVQFREQVDDCYPDRSRRSDGWIGDARHLSRKSDHNPDGDGWVFALDITADLGAHPEEAHNLVDEIRKAAKKGERRIKYIIFNGRISSPVLNWKWRKYRGANPHKAHFHISFTQLGKKDGSFFNIPMLGGTNERTETDGGNVGEDIRRDGSIDIPLSRTSTRLHSQCGTCECVAFRD
jgi:hypothetical protein